MKEMKRVLSLVLCFAMFVGMLPMFALGVSAEEAEWITIREPAETSTIYNYTRADSLTDGQTYALVHNGLALDPNRSAEKAASLAVTVDGDKVSSSQELALWTIAARENGGYSINVGDYCLRYHNGLAVHRVAYDDTAWTIENADGIFRISVVVGTNGNQYMYANESGWFCGSGVSDVSLYTYEGSEGGEAVPGLYARMEGATSYAIQQGASAYEVEKLILAGITAYTTSDTTAQGEVCPDGDLTLSGYSTDITESCEVTVSYEGVKLGQVTLMLMAPQTVEGTGTTTTTTPKTAYVLIEEEAPTAGNQYIIVNRGIAGSGYALKEETTTGSAITVNAAGNGISAPYIETTDETIMWNTASSGSSSTTRLTFQSQNGKNYLYYSSGLAFSTTDSTDWTVEQNRAYCSYRYSARYLKYSDDTWSASSGRDTVYFYEKQTVTVETTQTVNGIYSLAAENLTEIVEGETEGNLPIAELLFNGVAVNFAEGKYPVFEVMPGSDDIIQSIDSEKGTITYNGTAGAAQVKVSYTDDFGYGEGTVTDYITIITTNPYYSVDILRDGVSVTAPIVIKGQAAPYTLQLAAEVKKHDAESPDGDALENITGYQWSIVSGDAIASIDANGLLTYKGGEGEVKVKVVYESEATAKLEDEITVHFRTSTSITPEESTTDFPKWPDPGAVRFDKTAQAVGNFSNTGVALLELSLAGIPLESAGEVDVYLMVDMSSSVNSAGLVSVAKEAAVLFAQEITDSGVNDNRIAVGYFNGSSTHPTIFDFEEYEELLAEHDWAYIETQINTMSYSQGTYYDEALEEVFTVIGNREDKSRPVYVVFISDGAPNTFRYVDDDTVLSDKSTATVVKTTSQPNESHISSNKLHQKTEYWTYRMKQEYQAGVFAVGLNLDTDDDQYALALLQNMSSNAETNYANVSSGDKTQISAKLQAILSGFASEIKAAATNIEVSDQITDEYEMIFKWPTAVKQDDKVAGQEFYIEVVNYALDNSTKRRTGDYDVLTRLYLTEGEGGALSIDRLVKITGVTGSSDGTTTTLATEPKYEAVAEGEKGFFNLVGNEYVYTADGKGGYKMTAGATVTGTADTVVLHTPYFSYDASTKIIKWHVAETGATTEIALRYFLYLTDSLESADGEIDKFLDDDVTPNPDYVDAGTYPTNEEATLEYKNWKGNDCVQYFPEPQLTWNGAQVTYVFYLVNSNGEPVNEAGRVVQFSEAVFVTKPETQSVVWNEAENHGEGKLEASKVADDLLPDDYELFDKDTQYDIFVYEDEAGQNKNNHFKITGGNGTTIVYNTKSGDRYFTPKTYYANDVDNNFDFANTTVAFAVVWERKLVEDTVVVDFGLPVDIDVTTNDFVYNSIYAIGTETPTAAKNTGLYDFSALSYVRDEVSGMSPEMTIGGHRIQVINENVIRFTPNSMLFNAPITFHYETVTDYYENSATKQGYLYSSVTVIPATTIYFEDSFVDLTVFTKDEEGNYQESPWATVGKVVGTTQQQDRPGEERISADLDANNNYGYDAAYTTMSEYSLGGARKATVKSGTYAEAEFSFYGTGFDIISLTDTTTGFILVSVYNEEGTKVANTMVDTYYGYARSFWKVTYKYNEETQEWVADSEEEVTALGQSESKPENPENNATYTIYEPRWTTVGPNDRNALYQVPVIKMDLTDDQWNLPYGKYRVVITVSYMGAMDHTTAEGYDFYLDAIRIYNPTGNQNNTANDAYVKDGEGWPEYFEVRNKILEANTFDAADDTAVNGIVYVDGGVAEPTIADYQSFGPNNEVYLAPGSAIAFELSATATAGEIAKIQLAVKSVGGSASVKVYSTDGKVALDTDINTATDMYYDITDMNNKIVVIMNDGNGAVLSITNVKVTYTEEQVEPAPVMFMMRRSSVASVLATMEVEEEPEVETQPTEPEVPETEVPETTVPETEVPETTVPEETKPAKPDNSELKATVEAAKKLKEKDYTKDSYQNLKMALKTAEKVLKNKHATQAQIDAALEALEAAVNSLETKPDFDALQKVVDAAKKLKEKDYTKESFKVLKDALKDAEKVIKDKNASQAEIDNALAELKEAMESLEANAPAAKPGKPNPKETVETIINEIVSLLETLFGGRN